jgi:hypothetical protein
MTCTLIAIASFLIAFGFCFLLAATAKPRLPWW